MPRQILFLFAFLLGCSWLCVACGDDDPSHQDPCPPGATSEVCQVFFLVNEARVDNGLEPYVYDRHLARAAQEHARDMVDNNYFSHTSLDGRSFVDRINATAYAGSPRGENIAKGQRTPEQVMSSWMGSSGHRANILSAGSNEIGVGFYQNTWVQVFGFRRPVTP